MHWTTPRLSGASSDKTPTKIGKLEAGNGLSAPPFKPSPKVRPQHTSYLPDPVPKLPKETISCNSCSLARSQHCDGFERPSFSMAVEALQPDPCGRSRKLLRCGQGDASLPGIFHWVSGLRKKSVPRNVPASAVSILDGHGALLGVKIQYSGLLAPFESSIHDFDMSFPSHWVATTLQSTGCKCSA